MLSYKVKQTTNSDSFIDISISNDMVVENNNLLGAFELDTIKQNTNPVRDTEVVVYDPAASYQIKLSCLTSGGTSFTKYLNYMFTEQEVRSGSDKFLKSFYLLEFYETNDPRLNRLVYSDRIYFRSLIDSTGTLVDLLSFNLKNVQLFLPKNTNYSFLYLRVRLFNAKNGELKFFKTKNNDIYIKVLLNSVSDLWSFETSDYVALDEYKNPNELANIQNNSAFVPTQKYNTDKNKDYINADGKYTVIN